MMVEHTLRVRAIIVSNDHLLVCRLKARDVAFLPGGRVESGESLDAAIRREIIEETGSVVSALTYLGAIEHLWNEKGTPVHDLNHYFEAKCPVLSPERTPVCDDAGVGMVWVPIVDVDRLPLQPTAAKAKILEWLSGNRQIWWDFQQDI